MPTLVLSSSVFPHRHVVDRLNICMGHKFSLRIPFDRGNVGLNFYVNLWVLLFDGDNHEKEK